MCAVFESHSSNCVKMVAVFGSLQRYIPQLMSAMNEDEEEEEVAVAGPSSREAPRYLIVGTKHRNTSSACTG